MKPNHACKFTQIEKQIEPPTTRLSPPPSQSPRPNSVSTSIHLHIPLPRENSDALTHTDAVESFLPGCSTSRTRGGPKEGQGITSPPELNSKMSTRTHRNGLNHKRNGHLWRRK